MLAWETVRNEFEFDGSWRDIYVFQTTMSDWQHMLNAVRKSPYQVKYFRGGQPTEFPIDAIHAFPLAEECDRYLSVTFAGVQANCHFFWDEEIEFDIDPREVKGQTELDALFGFMQMLADAVGKEAVLTPENFRDAIIFRARPGSHEVEWQEFGGWR